MGCSKLELGERYPSPPWTKSPLFLPNLLPARRAAESTPGRWEGAAQGRGADRRISGGQQTHAMGWGGAGTDHSGVRAWGAGSWVPSVTKGTRCGPENSFFCLPLPLGVKPQLAAGTTAIYVFIFMTRPLGPALAGFSASPGEFIIPLLLQ